MPNPADNPGIVSDCATLLAVKDTLEGWSGALNWSPDTRISNWNGVSIDNNRASVSKLDLTSRETIALLRRYSNNYRLDGEIPPELSNLANLEQLSLSGNQLTGEIPPELGNLANLEELSLGGNQLTGCIPESVRAHLSDEDIEWIWLPFC